MCLCRIVQRNYRAGEILANLAICLSFTNVLPTNIFLTHNIFYRCLLNLVPEFSTLSCCYNKT